MEKPHLNFSVSRLLASLKAIAGRTMNADTLWHMIVVSVACVTLITCILGYVMYGWAKNTDLPPVIIKRDRSAFVPADLKKAIIRYQAKEARYNELLSTPPTAPIYVKGRGIVVTPLMASSTDNDIFVAATGTAPLAPTVNSLLLPQ